MRNGKFIKKAVYDRAAKAIKNKKQDCRVDGIAVDHSYIINTAANGETRSPHSSVMGVVREEICITQGEEKSELY